MLLVIFILITALAQQPFVRIEQCEYSTNYNVVKGQDGCIVTLPNGLQRFMLDCVVIGAKPQISFIWMRNGEEKMTENETSSLHLIQSDGTFHSTVSLRLDISKIEDGENFTCIAAGIAVQGTERQTAYIYVDTSSHGESIIRL